MVELDVVESITRAACGIALLLFVFIATFSRSKVAEEIVQRILGAVCFITAGLMIWLTLGDGSFYGSTALPPVLAFACIIVGIGSNLNIRGENISQGMNPHQIMRLAREEE